MTLPSLGLFELPAFRAGLESAARHICVVVFKGVMGLMVFLLTLTVGNLKLTNFLNRSSFNISYTSFDYFVSTYFKTVTNGCCDGMNLFWAWWVGEDVHRLARKIHGPYGSML